MTRDRTKISPGRRIARIAAITAGSLVLLIVAIVAGLAIYIGSSGFRGQMEQRAGVALGREIKIGDLQVDWSWAPRVRLRDVLLGGAAKDAPPMLQAQEIQFRLRLPPLLRGEVVLPEVKLTKPDLALAIDEKGVANWSFSKNPTAAAASEVAAPEERTEAPVIGELVVQDGRFKYQDDVKDLQLEGKLATAIGEAEKTGNIRLEANGRLQGKPLTVRFEGGSVLALREEGKPYPINLAAQYGETEVTVDGTAQDPFKLEAADLDLTLKGPNLAEVFPLLGVPAPRTPPYEVSGHLLREGDKWQFTGVQGRVGDSDLAGDITIDYGGEKPRLTADLVSDNLDFDDLAPLVGAPPDTEETASAEQRELAAQLRQEGELFPHVPLNADVLQTMDMVVKLDARKVRAEDYLPITALAGTVTVEGGKAVVEPFTIAIAGGSLEGALSLDSTQDPSVAAADLKMRNVDFKAFFKGTRYFDTTGGKIGADIDISGQGRSLAEVMGTSNGKAFLTMDGGAISGLLVEAAGLDLVEALVLYIGEDARVPIRCAAGSIDLAEGVAKFDRFIMDTTDSVLYFRGQSSLRQQTLVMDIFADAKDFSILDVDAPVHVEGKIRQPAISIGEGVPIPLIEAGDAENISCDLLLQGKL